MAGGGRACFGRVWWLHGVDVDPLTDLFSTHQEDVEGPGGGYGCERDEAREDGAGCWGETF